MKNMITEQTLKNLGEFIKQSDILVKGLTNDLADSIGNDDTESEIMYAEIMNECKDIWRVMFKTLKDEEIISDGDYNNTLKIIK